MKIRIYHLFCQHLYEFLKVNKENNTNIEIPKLKSNTLIYKGKFLSYFIKEYEINNQNNQKSSKFKAYETIDYNSRCFNQNEIPNEFVGKIIIIFMQ